jgi:exodeoxyribonuclease V gamma subunit
VKIVGDEPFESVTAVHQVDDCTITGVLEKITPAGQILWSVDGATPWNLIRAWCQHLLLNAQDDAPTRCSFLIGPEAIVRFSPIDDASENLSVWASQYQQGRTRPLPFFPRSALKFVEGNEASLKPAYEIWLGADYSKSRGEAEDPYFALAFRDNIEQALDGEFEKLAPLIFRPMVNAMKVVTG